jgi:two-component system sensor histidine kinase UhpB
MPEIDQLSFPSARQHLPASGRAGAAVLLGTALAAFAAQWLVVQLWVPPVRVSTIWLPGGLILGITLLSEPKRWLAVIAAGCTGTTLVFILLRLVPPPVAVVLELLTGLVTYILAALVRAAIGRPLTLATLAEFGTYLGTVVLGGALIASVFFLVAVWGFEVRPATFTTWRTFALSVTLGFLAVTPAVVLGVRNLWSARESGKPRSNEAALLGLLLILCLGLAFSRVGGSMVGWSLSALTMPPLLLWAVARFGPLGGSTALVLVSVLATAMTARGQGPFTSMSSADNTLSLQLFILGVGVPLMALAAVLSEQRRTREELRSSNAQLLELTRELITARDEEGARIARELHDDVGQRVALLAIGLSRLRRALKETGPVPEIHRLQDETGSLARSLRQISHQLHPAALEHAGLMASLELKCDEVRQATALAVRLSNAGDTAAIPQDVALCVYRVAQEALSNVIRHSGASSVDLLLRQEDGDLFLQVTDDGHGLRTPVPGPGSGRGLRFAAERVRAVGGVLRVESLPGQGTTVSVAVPLNGSNHA